MITFQSFLSKDLTLRMLQIIAFLRLFYGNYVTISESRAICYLVKLYCIGVCSFIALFGFYAITQLYSFTIISFTLIDYFMTALIFVVFSDQPILHFFSGVQTQDRIIGFKKMSYINKYMYFILFCTSFMRLAFFIHRIITSYRSNLEFILVVYILTATDLNYLLLIIIFSVLHNRMNRLRLFLESNSIPINITGQNRIAISIQNVKKGLIYYDRLLDSLQSLDKILQCQLMVYSITQFLRISMMSYRLIQQFMVEYILLRSTINVLELIPTALFVFAPLIFVEATTYEVERIKTILTAQILRSSDECLRFELQTALQYVRLRPFRYTLCRAVPLDINLIFTTASLCITYVIVACQLVYFSK
ncbi:hypothetical protein B5X24_HaOG200953 [Helicoverpa armigera]|uniref:Gustatory receptor n=1 Tax=Helicoverpa armigera TaxID=29058 RepID=A0A2W1BBR6_HELAM|nr:hypothetical protein B5X24_HaOG200953 [Helicoverpa armigera]